MKYERLTHQKYDENIDLTQEYGYSYIYKRLYELEDKIEIGYVEVKTKDDIFNTIANLSIVDYKELLTDPNLNAISNISGIRHQFDSKLCENENCKQDMGLMAVEPETLFFTIAEQELPN